MAAGPMDCSCAIAPPTFSNGCQLQPHVGSLLLPWAAAPAAVQQPAALQQPAASAPAAVCRSALPGSQSCPHCTAASCRHAAPYQAARKLQAGSPRQLLLIAPCSPRAHGTGCTSLCTSTAWQSLRPTALCPSLRRSPCFIMSERNLISTLEEGRSSTCFLPRFSALYIVFCGGGGGGSEERVSSAAAAACPLQCLTCGTACASMATFAAAPHQGISKNRHASHGDSTVPCKTCGSGAAQHDARLTPSAQTQQWPG